MGILLLCLECCSTATFVLAGGHLLGQPTMCARSVHSELARLTKAELRAQKGVNYGSPITIKSEDTPPYGRPVRTTLIPELR